MRIIQASALIFCLVAAPGVSLAADAKADVEKAYAAWDAAFNKHDEKAIGAAYVTSAKLLPPTHQVASGPAEIEKFFAGLFAGGVTGHKLEMITPAETTRSCSGQPSGVRPARTRRASLRLSVASQRTYSSARRTAR
ncbi:hypothetical protein SAMN05216338_106915 [Bradyrhizobium sp. Rc2d]|nr:hypothetical protein SAMN05216338_106915 [Bradyrhizobium sp. Rc2d]